jgi:hypothetical protein
MTGREWQEPERIIENRTRSRKSMKREAMRTGGRRRNGKKWN